MNPKNKKSISNFKKIRVQFKFYYFKIWSLYNRCRNCNLSFYYSLLMKPVYKYRTPKVHIDTCVQSSMYNHICIKSYTVRIITIMRSGRKARRTFIPSFTLNIILKILTLIIVEIKFHWYLNFSIIFFFFFYCVFCFLMFDLRPSMKKCPTGAYNNNIIYGKQWSVLSFTSHQVHIHYWYESKYLIRYYTKWSEILGISYQI